MNLILENVQPKHISLIQELAKTLHFQVKEDNSIKKSKKKLSTQQKEFVDTQVLVWVAIVDVIA